MNRIFRTAILAMAMMISASFAWGQNPTASATILTVTVSVPQGTMANALKATITWRDENGVITADDNPQVQEILFTGQTTPITFPWLFIAPQGTGRTPTHVSYCIRAINNVFSPAETVKSAGGTYNVSPADPNVLIITTNMWQNGTNGCFGSEPREYKDNGQVDP